MLNRLRMSGTKDKWSPVIKKNMDIPENYIHVARRLNNLKRRHLYVNALQAKHIPSRPEDALEMFEKLADKVEQKWGEKRLLIIGFAETATALGAALAVSAALDGYFVCTTREFDPHKNYIEFSESHSHATRQLLNAQGLDCAVEDADRIIFTDDEVSTANTIEGLIHKLKQRYGRKDLKFGIASVLNSVDATRNAELAALGIDQVCLNKIPANWRAEEADNYNFDANKNITENNYINSRVPYDVKYINAPYTDQRVMNKTKNYKQAAETFAEQFTRYAELKENDKNILVLGTEEFMYPAVLSALLLSRLNPDKRVYTHSTTRSPIEVLRDPGYPLFSRTEILSLYEKNRKNYIYNLRTYDKVYVVTDAVNTDEQNFIQFTGALKETGADGARFIVWNRDNMK